MWNLLYSNQICFKKKTAQDQLRHITQIQSAKCCVKTESPWQPKHSLSKLQNKYTNNMISNNNVLLARMMEIQKKNCSYKTPMSYYTIESLRKKEKRKIINENQSFLRRLQSASTVYPLKLIQKDHQRIQSYRENLQRRQKTHDDFNILAQQESLRKSVTSSQSQRRKIYTSQGQRMRTSQTVGTLT